MRIDIFVLELSSLLNFLEFFQKFSTYRAHTEIRMLNLLFKDIVYNFTLSAFSQAHACKRDLYT